MFKNDVLIRRKVVFLEPNDQCYLLADDIFYQCYLLADDIFYLLGKMIN